VAERHSIRSELHQGTLRSYVEFTDHQLLVGSIVESVTLDKTELDQIILKLQDGRRVRVLGLWFNNGGAGLVTNVVKG